MLVRPINLSHPDNTPILSKKKFKHNILRVIALILLFTFSGILEQESHAERIPWFENAKLYKSIKDGKCKPQATFKGPDPENNLGHFYPASSVTLNFPAIYERLHINPGYPSNRELSLSVVVTRELVESIRISGAAANPENFDSFFEAYPQATNQIMLVISFIRPESNGRYGTVFADADVYVTFVNTSNPYGDVVEAKLRIKPDFFNLSCSR